MLFPRRDLVVAQYTGTAALGSSISFSIVRQFFLDSLLVVVPVQIVTPSGTTYTTGGLASIVKRIQLNVNDGTTNRMQTDSSGFGIIRRAARVLSGLDQGSYGTNSAANPYRTFEGLGVVLNQKETNSAGSTAGYYSITYPLLFKHPQIADPVGSIFMLPLPRYNINPTLTIQFGQTSDVMSTIGSSASLVIGTPYVVQVMRQINNTTFPTVETQVQEYTQTIAASGANQIFTLQQPGSYSAIDLYLTNSSGVGQDISNGPWQLQFLGQMIRQFYLFDVKTAEQYSMGSDVGFSTGNAGRILDVFPGFFHLDFLHDQYGMEVAELGSLFNTNVLAGSGATPQINMTLGSTGTVAVVTEMFMGDLSAYGMSYNPQGN
jgi:hypothetical protein